MRTHRLGRCVLGVVVAVSSLPIVAGTAGAAAGEGITRGRVTVMYPERQILVEPVELPAIHSAGIVSPRAAGGGSEGPVGRSLDPEGLARAKRAAVRSPHAPAATVLRFAETPGRATVLPAPSRLAVDASFEGHDATTFTTTEPDGKTIWSVNAPSPLVAASASRILHATLYGLMLVNRPDNDNRHNVSVWDLFGLGKNNSGEPSLGHGTIAYDPASERFFYAAPFWGRQLNQAWIQLLVSRRSDPTGFGANDWCMYKINTKVRNGYASDPAIGLDDDLFVIAANSWKLTGDAFNGVYFWVVDKASLVDNSASCPALNTSRVHAKNDDQGYEPYQVKPTVRTDDTGPAGLFMLSTQWRDGVMSEYIVWRILERNSSRGPRVRVTSSRVSGKEYEHPPDAPQKGGGELDTGEATIVQAVLREGRLYGVHALACSLGAAPNESCERLVEVDVGDTVRATRVAAQTTFGAGRNKYAFRAGLAVTGDGRSVVPFLYSAGNRFLSTAFTDVPAGGGKPSKATFLKKGNYGPQCGSNHMNVGLWAWAQADPSDDATVLIAGEYGNKGTRQQADARCRWSTRIGVLR